MWLTAVTTPGPYIAPWGVYAPSNVTGSIALAADGSPTGAASLTPSVEVWNNASSTQAFTLSLTVVDRSGAVVATTTGGGSVAGGGVTVWSPAAPLTWTNAALWDLVALPLTPALYTLVTVLAVGAQGNVDAANVTFGVRRTRWDAADGFFLNDGVLVGGKATKILGNANHQVRGWGLISLSLLPDVYARIYLHILSIVMWLLQDFAGVGVAVPDKLQWHRIAKQKEFGSNGWRTVRADYFDFLYCFPPPTLMGCSCVLVVDTPPSLPPSLPPSHPPTHPHPRTHTAGSQPPHPRAAGRSGPARVLGVGRKPPERAGRPDPAADLAGPQSSQRGNLESVQ